MHMALMLLELINYMHRLSIYICILYFILANFYLSHGLAVITNTLCIKALYYCFFIKCLFGCHGNLIS